LEASLEPFRYHAFVCTQEKPEGVPCCSAAGSFRFLDALHGALGAQGLADEVQVSSCGCLGICDSGPVMIVYPEGVWYTKLTANDVPEIVSSHFQAGKKVARLERSDSEAMKAEMLDHRNKYLAMLKAKDAAGVLPDDISEMIRGFMPSRAILTALELDLFTAVGNGGTAAQIASKIQCAVRATETLLNVLAALKLLQKSGDTYTNTPLAARFFVEGTPDSARMAQLHIANIWKSWSTLTEAVKAGTSVAPRADNGSVKPFIAAMDHNARGRARAVVQAVEVDGAKRLLDLGGGSAAYSIAFAKAAPGLRQTWSTWPMSCPSRRSTSAEPEWPTASLLAPATCSPLLSMPVSTIWFCSRRSATCSLPKRTSSCSSAPTRLSPRTDAW